MFQSVATLSHVYRVTSHLYTVHCILLYISRCNLDTLMSAVFCRQKDNLVDLIFVHNNRRLGCIYTLLLFSCFRTHNMLLNKLADNCLTFPVRYDVIGYNVTGSRCAPLLQSHYCQVG
jgi:hypothetical protein